MNYDLEFSKSYVDNFILIKRYTFYVYMGRLEISFNNFILINM